MNIKVHGFTWNIEPFENNIEVFLRYFQSLNQVEMDSLNAGLPPGVNYKRITLITSLDDGLWGGIFWTVKNTRKFIRSTRSGKGFKITTSEIEKNQNFADANFFIFNPQTGAGLYEYYHLSAYLNTFNLDAKYKFGLFRSINNLKARFVFTQHLNPSDFQKHVELLATVHNAEYELSTIAVPDAGIVPASGYVSRQRIKVFFERTEYANEGLKKGLEEFIKHHIDNLKRMFVTGKNIHGDDITYSLIDDTSTLAEREFRNFNIDLDLSGDINAALKESSNLKHLIETSKKLSVKDFFYAAREQ